MLTTLLSTLIPIGVLFIVGTILFNVFDAVSDFVEEYWPFIVAFVFFGGAVVMIVFGSLGYSNPWALPFSLTKTAKLCLIIFGAIILTVLLVVAIWLIWDLTYENRYYSYSYGNSSNYDDTQNNKIEKDIKSSKKLNLTKSKIDKFDEFFGNKVIGQSEAQQKIKTQLIHCMYQLDDKLNRPAGIFFFVGPTGVGKTEMAKTLSEFLYDNKNLNRFDMSEYKSEMATQQLLGAPNGYVGYEEGGTLINAMKNNPNSIVLFDEIEKADKSVFDLFLQILDEGTITSNKGEKVKFKNNFIIFTSNIGASYIEENMTNEESNEVIKEAIEYFFTNELNRPEILGRIGKDNIIPFNMINKKEDIYKILDIYFNDFINQLKKKKIALEFNKESVYDSIMIDVDKTKGARDIRNEFEVFKKHFVSALFEANLDYDKLKNQTLCFDYDNVKVTIKKYEAIAS